MDEIPSILHHVSIGTADWERAVAFYDAVMPTIGAEKKLTFPGAAAYGKQFPEFWVQGAPGGQRPTKGDVPRIVPGAHYAFIAPSKEAVQAFYDAALAAGGASDGEPGLRPDYGPGYYACFVIDLDGHKLEAAIVPAPEAT